MDENNQLVKKLKENLKLKDKELCETQRRLDECKNENNKLNKVNQMLEMDLKSLNTKFDEAISCKSRLTSERDSLSDDLEMKCRQLSELKAQYDKEIKDHKCSYDNLFKALTEVNKSSAQNHYKMKNSIQKLQNEICSKKDELCELKKKIKELERENDANLMEINAQKTKLFEKECHLKRMALISDKILKIKKCDVCCCPEKKIENQITRPVCSTEDPCCSQSNPCEKPITNVATDDCNVIDSTDLKKLFCQLELLRNDVRTSLKNN